MARQVHRLAGSNQPHFTLLYDRYAPKLWGMIQLAKLPTARSELVLLNTFKRAWKQLYHTISPVEPTFTWLLTIAYSEGLPKEFLRNSLSTKRPTTRMNDDHPHVGRPIPVLIAGCSQEDQALLTQTLKASMPQIETIFCSRTDQALQYLQTSSPGDTNFPRLLLLSISGGQTDWQLLQQIKAAYRQLPIVIIAEEQQAGLAPQAYDLGVHSFLVKSFDLKQWEKKLASLADYWLTVVTLPNQKRN